jgi:hypothetical protein
MLLRHVTRSEIETAIHEMMDGCEYSIVASGNIPQDRAYNGGYYVTINNHADRVLLYYADTFYQKLNDYCVMVESEESYPK